MQGAQKASLLSVWRGGLRGELLHWVERSGGKRPPNRLGRKQTPHRWNHPRAESQTDRTLIQHAPSTNDKMRVQRARTSFPESAVYQAFHPGFLERSLHVFSPPTSFRHETVLRTNPSHSRSETAWQSPSSLWVTPTTSHVSLPPALGLHLHPTPPTRVP